mmetsp:Transcript_5144/g.13823  ORF Transcript_5144/g.13823 Transcript_5144/m.13823 type:complete len:87 (+) Transcript_5144:157-417(+)
MEVQSKSNENCADLALFELMERYLLQTATCRFTISRVHAFFFTSLSVAEYSYCVSLRFNAATKCAVCNCSPIEINAHNELSANSQC